MIDDVTVPHVSAVKRVGLERISSRCSCRSVCRRVPHHDSRNLSRIRNYGVFPSTLICVCWRSWPFQEGSDGWISTVCSVCVRRRVAERRTKARLVEHGGKRSGIGGAVFGHIKVLPTNGLKLHEV